MKDKSKAKKIISSDGVEVYYWLNYIKGNREKFSFLHPGSSMNHSSMERLENELNNEGHSTLVLDPRGSGYSITPNAPEFFKLSRYTTDVLRILSTEGIEDPTMIGHSMGFMPCVDYVAQTNNAERIVGIAGSYHFPDTVRNPSLFKLFNKVLRYNEIVGSVLTNIFGHLATGTPRIYNDQSHVSDAWSAYLSIVDVHLHEVRSHIISEKEINKWNIIDQLKALRKPLLLIYGKRDDIVVPETAEVMQFNTGSSCAIYSIDAGHEMPMTHPEELAKIIEQNEAKR